jgi:hypothetical protein
MPVGAEHKQGLDQFIADIPEYDFGNDDNNGFVRSCHIH